MDRLREELLQLPEWGPILERLRKGDVLSLDGICESARPFVMSCLGVISNRPMGILASTAKQQEHLHSETAAWMDFFRAGEVLSFSEIEVPLDGQGTSPSLPDMEGMGERMGVLKKLREGFPRGAVVTTHHGWCQSLPDPARLGECIWKIRVGEKWGMDEFVQRLLEAGFEGEGMVSGKGQFARRGGIVDLYPFHSAYPIRMEFMGDVVESIRGFDVETQASIHVLKEMEIMSGDAVGGAGADGVTLEDYLPKDHVLWREPLDLKESSRVQFSGVLGEGETVAMDFHGHDFTGVGEADRVMHEHRQGILFKRWREWLRSGWRVMVCCNNEGEEKRLKELLNDPVLIDESRWVRMPLPRGFIWPVARWVVLSDAEIFGRYQSLSMARVQQRMARARARREVMDFSRFQEGDLVVHMQHGIGKFLGVQVVSGTGGGQEALTLEYAGGSLLHVPIDQAHLVGRYVGVGKASPSLDELGGKRWGKAAAEAQSAVMDYAARLLKIEAERRAQKGFRFAPDHEWQEEFEESFLYDETRDQLTAIEDAKEDMESDRPMDRLICGDVGFGKTEVAIRAAFKAVMNGKQVAVLVPTTVLAQQHERTFKERMADYPVTIEMLSRFRTRREQTQVLRDAREGGVDIVIGTHRLLQKDMIFKDLGLVIVDEEQRFGVKHKERFKEIFSLVDILTLSATPIPRTLYLSLMGAKDISTIETPPPNRLPVETLVAAYDERLIRSAIQKELARGGQVYFLHNRIQSIQRVRDRIVELVPGARVEFGHGQMETEELESIMMRFVAGEIDVLVATTIIESGLDIPRANTIIIDRADRFGLADLYQLRGRVGRSQMKAHAYLLLPRHLMLEATSRKRVSVVKQYSHLGAGFQVAMRDLEIRGAGSVLGTRQSGHATAIGFELYCQLLKQTISRLKGEKVKARVETAVKFDFLPVTEEEARGGVGAYIPKIWVTESTERIRLYRKLAELDSEKELKAWLADLEDRYGRAPEPVKWLVEMTRVRLLGSEQGLSSVMVEDGKVMLKKKGEYLMQKGRFPRITDGPDGLRGKIKDVIKVVTSGKF